MIILNNNVDTTKAHGLQTVGFFDVNSMRPNAGSQKSSNARVKKSMSPGMIRTPSVRNDSRSMMDVSMSTP